MLSTQQVMASHLLDPPSSPSHGPRRNRLKSAYPSDETEYAALINNAVIFAKELNLRVDITGAISSRTK